MFKILPTTTTITFWLQPPVNSDYNSYYLHSRLWSHKKLHKIPVKTDLYQVYWGEFTATNFWNIKNTERNNSANCHCCYKLVKSPSLKRTAWTSTCSHPTASHIEAPLQPDAQGSTLFWFSRKKNPRKGQFQMDHKLLSGRSRIS